jgi:hypothetical protein
MTDRFAQIMDRQLTTDREGEAERQACPRETKGRKTKGEGKGRKTRRRMKVRGGR